jgi:hypothetical protein
LLCYNSILALSTLSLLMSIQAHVVCKGQNELIMSSMTVLKIFFVLFTVMKVLFTVMSFTFQNEV